MKEKFMVKMNQIIDRKLCQYRGMEQTHRHNLEKVKEMEKIQTKREPKCSEKKTKTSYRKNRSDGPSVVKYEPNFTTKREIEKKIKEKGLKIGTRKKSETRIMRWKEGNSTREVVMLNFFQFIHFWRIISWSR